MAKIKQRNISAYELASLGEISGAVNFDQLEQLTTAEVKEFSKSLSEEKTEEIMAILYELKTIRLKLIAANNILNNPKIDPELKEDAKIEAEELEGELKALLEKLSTESGQIHPDQQELYTKYLKTLLLVEQLYNEKVMPVRDEEFKLKGKRDLLTARISRYRKDPDAAESVPAIESMRDKIDLKLQQIQEFLEEINDTDKGFKEFFNIERIDYLMSIREQLNRGQFVELNGLRTELEFIKNALRLNLPVMLVGDLGSGKTEALIHAAKEHLIELKKFTPEQYDEINILVFSGSKEASIYDLVGKMKIRHKELSVSDRVKKLEIEAKEAGINLPHSSSQVFEMAIKAYDSGWTYSEFAQGVLAEAVVKGVPIIIDEIDQVQPEILSRINHLMTRKPGQTWRIQENGEEEVPIAEGFAVMATANLKSGRYKTREEIDAAFASRLLIREHDYLTMEDSYDLLLGYFSVPEIASLKPDIPAEAFAKFPKLVVAMKEIQEVFQGRFKTVSLFEASGAEATKHMELKKTTFSTRSLINILDYWTGTGMNKISLDEAIGTVLLSPIEKSDQLYILDILLRFGFFKGWKAADFKTKLNIQIGDEKLGVLLNTLESEVGQREQQKFTKITEEVEKSFLATARAVGYVPKKK